jgi:hypothetical protein
MRRLAFGLLLFVAADFGTPFIGGAFTFDAETSVEGLRLDRDRAMTGGQRVLMPLPIPIESERVARPAPEQIERSSATALRWVTALPRARVLADPPSAFSEDH